MFQTGDFDFGLLRRELARRDTRRQARRYRRRWFSRWRRRRLLTQLVAVEHDLAEPPHEHVRALRAREVERLERRLARNAERLFR